MGKEKGKTNETKEKGREKIYKGREKRYCWDKKETKNIA